VVGILCPRLGAESTRTIVGTMIWTENRPVIKIGPKGALGSHEIRPIHSAPSLGQSIRVPTGYYSGSLLELLSCLLLGAWMLVGNDIIALKVREFLQ